MRARGSHAVARVDEASTRLGQGSRGILDHGIVRHRRVRSRRHACGRGHVRYRVRCRVHRAWLQSRHAVARTSHEGRALPSDERNPHAAQGTNECRDHTRRGWGCHAKHCITAPSTAGVHASRMPHAGHRRSRAGPHEAAIAHDARAQSHPSHRSAARTPIARAHATAPTPKNPDTLRPFAGPPSMLRQADKAPPTLPERAW
jgi:hypothetical protein